MSEDVKQGWTPGPWHYEPGGGHASNRIVGSDSVQFSGWPHRINGTSNASYTNRVCENLGDPKLPGPAANIRLIAQAPALYDALMMCAVHYQDGPCWCHVHGEGRPMNEYLCPPHVHDATCMECRDVVRKAETPA